MLGRGLQVGGPGVLESLLVPLHNGGGGIVPRGTREALFEQIFWVFLVLGTLVGVVVIAYMTYNAYHYRDGNGEREADLDRPELGELPRGSGSGKKLFLSFAISTVIVVSLIAWTYGALLYVEQPAHGETGDTLQIKVEGYRFAWSFIYPNGHEAIGTLRVPRGREIRLRVTSRDVFHNFGIPALKVKADAIPGRTTDTWFIANEPGTYRAACYELCGVGHSAMNAEVVVMEQDAYRQWYANTSES